MKVCTTLRSSILFLFLFTGLASATVRYVSLAGDNVPPYTNWSFAANTIQTAIDASVDGDTILVAPGVYDTGRTNDLAYMTGNRVYLTKNILIRSIAGAESTIISGSSLFTNLIRCLYMTKGVVSGFTLSNGATAIEAGDGNDIRGGGAFINGAGSLLKNSIVTWNSASEGGGIYIGNSGGVVMQCHIGNNNANNNVGLGGGGVFLDSPYAEVHSCFIHDNETLYGGSGGGIYAVDAHIIADSVIQNNISEYNGGGIYIMSDNTEVKSCVVRNNHSMFQYGGGIYTLGSIITDSLIYSNTARYGGGGIYCDMYGTAIVERCRIVQNKANNMSAWAGGVYGAKIYDSVICSNLSVGAGGGIAHGMLERCVVAGNIASNFGGGVVNGNVNNSLVVRNTAFYEGGGVYASVIRNSTICYNSAQMYNGGVQLCFVTNSIVYYNTYDNFGFQGSEFVASCTYPTPIAGVLCITNAPLFISSNDLHLSSVSPCINAGKNAGVKGPFDLDGRMRIINGIVDMGAFEYSLAPANDLFALAQEITGTNGTTSADNTYALPEMGEQQHGMNGGPYHSMWWKYAFTQNGMLELDTTGSNFDTVLAVYTGTTFATLVEVTATNPPAIAISKGMPNVGIKVHMRKGYLIHIVVDGKMPADIGTITLNWRFTTAPDNDDFAAATEITGDIGSINGTNTTATVEIDECEHALNGGPYHSVWWKWTALESGNITVKTEGSSFDTVLGMYTGTAVCEVVEIAANDDEENNFNDWSEINVHVTAGVTYYFAVDGSDEFETGTIAMQWDFISDTYTPPNDNFSDALILTNIYGGQTTGNNTSGTGEAGEPAHADNGGPHKSVWWRWTAPSNGTFTASTTGSVFDTVLAMYSGNVVNGLTEITANDDAGSETYSVISASVQQGETYSIAIDGYDTDEYGAIQLAWLFIPDVAPVTPANDDFVDAAYMNGFVGMDMSTNTFATTEIGEPAHGDSGPYHSVWWKWTAPGSNMYVDVATGDTGVDTVLAMYTGTTVQTLTKMAWNDDDETTFDVWSRITTNIVSDETFYFAVDGIDSSETGIVSLIWNIIPQGFGPINDDFVDATTITGWTGQVAGNNIGATAEPGEPEHAENFGPYVSVWWQWTAPADGFFNVSTEGSINSTTFDELDTVLAVYTGTAVNALGEIASNDDEDNGLGYWSEVTTDVYAGVTYNIAVDGYDSDEQGNISLQWHFTPLSMPAPDVQVFEINSGVASTTNRNVQIHTVVTESPSHYKISPNNNFIGVTWQAYSADFTYTLTPSPGTKTLYYKAKNGMGESTVVSDTITLEATPHISQLAINNGAGITTSQLVRLDNTALNSPTEYMASENAGFSGASWHAYSSSPTFTLSAGAGGKTIYMKLRNAVGESSAASDTITYVTPPVQTSFALNNGAMDTTNRLVTLNNAQQNAPTHYMASEDAGFAGGTWEAYSTAPFYYIASAGDGIKEVYFKTRNAAGESTVLSDTINLLPEVIETSGTGFYMKVIEPTVRVGDIFHIQLFSQLEAEWDYICQHIKRDTISQSAFSFLNVLPSGIVPTSYYENTIGIDLQDAKVTIHSNNVHGVNDGVIASIECRAESAGDSYISYTAKSGGYKFKNETCALSNGMDILRTSNNHLDGMENLAFSIEPNIAGIEMSFKSDYSQYITGDIVTVSVQLSNTYTAHYNTASVLLEYTTNVLEFVSSHSGVIAPAALETHVAPGGFSNRVSVVAQWDDTHTDDGVVMTLQFRALKNGRAKITPLAPDANTPSADNGTTIIKNWVDVMDSPSTWIYDMPEGLSFNIYPFKRFSMVARPTIDIVNVGEEVDVAVVGRAQHGAAADRIGIALDYDVAHLQFVSIQPNYSLIENVTWNDEGTYVWLSADLIDTEGNIDGKTFATITCGASRAGTAHVNYKFLAEPDAFEQGSTYAIWNAVDVLGDPEDTADGVVGCDVIVAEDDNSLQSVLRIQGQDTVPNGAQYNAYIVCETNQNISPTSISCEIAWENDTLNYNGYKLITPTAAFSQSVHSNEFEGYVRLWSDNVNIADCVGTVAVVRFTVVDEWDTELEFLSPNDSALGGTYIRDVQGSDLLGTAYDEEDGMLGKDIVVTETEAYFLNFASPYTIINPGQTFTFDIIITNYAGLFAYDTISVLCEYDADDTMLLGITNSALAGATMTRTTNYGDYFAMEFTWPYPTNVCGSLAQISAITYGDFDLDFAFEFGDTFGVFPGTYALNNQKDVLGSPSYDEDGTGEDLELENSGLPSGASLHLIAPTSVDIGDVFYADLVLTNNSGVKITSINVMFEVEKDALEVEQITQGNFGGTLINADINHMNGRIHYRETFTQPTLVSGVICRLRLFARGAFDYGSIESITPSSEYEEDGTFIRNGFVDMLGWSDDEDDGGADLMIDITMTRQDKPILFLDDINEYEVDAEGMMMVEDVGEFYLENRDVEEDSLEWTIEQVAGTPADAYYILPVPPYPLLIYPHNETVGTQLFKVTVYDHNDPSAYSYDYVGIIIAPKEDYIYPKATDDISTSTPDFIYKSDSGRCTFNNGVFTITGGTEKDSLKIRTPGNFDAVISDSGLKRLFLEGSLNTLAVNGAVGTVKIKNGNLGDVTADSVKKIAITAPRHYVKDEDTFDDMLDMPQGLVGAVKCDGDIGTLIVKSGDVGALDDGEDYGQIVISENGNIGKIIAKGKKRSYFEKGWGKESYFGGGNIFASIRTPGEIKKIFAQNYIGWDNIDNPAIISADGGIKNIKLAWKKVRDGDEPSFLANVFTPGELKSLSVKGGYLGTDDMQTTIHAGEIGSVKCKLWRDYYIDDGDPWVDTYGGDMCVNVISEGSIKSAKGAGDQFTSRIIAGADITTVSYKGYRDEEGDLWGGDMYDTFIAAGLSTHGERQTGSIKNIKVGYDLFDSIILAGCVFADRVPGYKGSVGNIKSKSEITSVIIGSGTQPKMKAKEGWTDIRYYLNGQRR